MARRGGFSFASFRRGDAILFRHLAICLAALAVYRFRDDFQAGNEFLWIIGLAALLNIALAFIAGRPPIAAMTHLLSAGGGLLGWAALTYLTGGARSPFVLGFGFEIILSALHASPRLTFLVTGGAIGALWGQQLILTSTTLPLGLWLQTALLAAMGGLVSDVATRWRVRGASLTRRIDSLQRRLGSLEMEIDDARLLGTIGVRAARRSHHLLNLVHNLRGFSQILRSELTGTGGDREAVAGLLSSIDRLESLARDTLQSSDRGPRRQDRAAGTEILTSLDAVIEETGRSFPSIRWITKAPSQLPDIQVPRSDLSEVLQILVRNAAEASREAGEVYLSLKPRRRHLELQIRDRGEGLPTNGDLFRPGRTSKANGCGYGLFLARQILCMYGGRINARTAPGGGAEMSLRLPLALD